MSSESTPNNSTPDQQQQQQRLLVPPTTPTTSTDADYSVLMGTPLDRPAARPSRGINRQSSTKEFRRRLASASRSRSRSPSSTPNNNSNTKRKSLSNVWSSESMTSFRISRRSLMITDYDLQCRESNLRRSTKKSNSNNIRSRSNSFCDLFLGHESNNTTLILEEDEVTPPTTTTMMTPSSLHHHHRSNLNNTSSDDHDRLASSNSNILDGNGDDTDPLYLRRSFQNSNKNNSARYSQQHQQLADDDDNDNDEMKSHDPPPARYSKELLVFRRQCGNLVNSLVVQLVMSLFIVANAVLLGALTFDTIPSSTIRVLEIMDLIILVAFTIELALHSIYLGLALFRDSWLTFDFIVILLSWCFLGSPLAILRSFRIFRVFSLVSRWESLRTLFEAIGSTIPKMASIWASLLIFFYVFCVLFTTVYKSLYDDGYLDDDYFGRLDKTFVTLFQFMTLDNWSEVARQVMEYNPWSFLGFFVFIIFSSFFIVNLVVAVICESLIQISRAPPSPARGAAPAAFAACDDDDENAHEQVDQTMILQDMMRQLLHNQMSMAASLESLQRDVSELKDHNNKSNDNKRSKDSRSSSKEESKE